jgi:tRNA-dihydrouridine synthase
MYTGDADWTLIGKIKENLRMHIPIIGNGDVKTPERAKECFERYGVDAVMIGRASFGQPWIFRDVKHYLEHGEPAVPFTFRECMDILREQVRDSVDWLGERPGILHVRRHLAATPLLKGLADFRPLRIEMLRAEKVEDLMEILDRIVDTYGND